MSFDPLSRKERAKLVESLSHSHLVLHLGEKKGPLFLGPLFQQITFPVQPLKKGVKKGSHWIGLLQTRKHYVAKAHWYKSPKGVWKLRSVSVSATVAAMGKSLQLLNRKKLYIIREIDLPGSEWCAFQLRKGPEFKFWFVSKPAHCSIKLHYLYEKSDFCALFFENIFNLSQQNTIQNPKQKIIPQSVDHEKI